MVIMRESWTDERLDDLNKKVDDGFQRVDQRFIQIDQRFAQVDQRFVQMDQRIDNVQRTMWQGFAWVVGLQITFFIATIGFIATQT
jgi:tetrahydromethanopterin S-methyltransferase subunit G